MTAIKMGLAGIYLSYDEKMIVARVVSFYTVLIISYGTLVQLFSKRCVGREGVRGV